ncbi:hypothetical protein RHSIM_Rhsim09G0046400 [Rhododendron simsii]|uniref:Uncharacterized protein n=1 Tax=Rhododendron simsii TaxID=118357 RepID=A0A834LE86_RHOSS|nr:hypothetical protein RHSIM_Rhsim09G0046400 [Rhododendron simsii]
MKQRRRKRRALDAGVSESGPIMPFFPCSCPIATDEETARCRNPEAYVVMVFYTIAAVCGNTRTEDIEYSKPQWVGRRGSVLDAVHYMNFAFARIPRKFLGRRGFGDIENCYQDEKMKESIDPHCTPE